MYLSRISQFQQLPGPGPILNFVSLSLFFAASNLGQIKVPVFYFIFTGFGPYA